MRDAAGSADNEGGVRELGRLLTNAGTSAISSLSHSSVLRLLLPFHKVGQRRDVRKKPSHSSRGQRHSRTTTSLVLFLPQHVLPASKHHESSRFLPPSLSAPVDLGKNITATRHSSRRSRALVSR